MKFQKLVEYFKGLLKSMEIKKSLGKGWDYFFKNPDGTERERSIGISLINTTPDYTQSPKKSPILQTIEHYWMP